MCYMILEMMVMKSTEIPRKRLELISKSTEFSKKQRKCSLKYVNSKELQSKPDKRRNELSFILRRP